MFSFIIHLPPHERSGGRKFTCGGWRCQLVCMQLARVALWDIVLIVGSMAQSKADDKGLEMNDVSDFLPVDGEDLEFQPAEWEIGNSCSAICICDIPSVENLVNCSGETCPIGCYHRECVGLGLGDNFEAEEDWKCNFCSNSENIENAISDDRYGPTTSEGVKAANTTTSNIGINNQQKAAAPPAPGRKKKKKVYRSIQITKEEVLEKGEQLVVDAIQQLDEDKFYKDGEVTQLGKKIDPTTDSFKVLSRRMTSMLWDCCEAGKKIAVGPSANQAMFTKLHKLRSSEEVFTMWTDFLHAEGLESSERIKRLLLQFLIRNVFQAIMRLRDNLDCQPVVSFPDEFMSKEEEAVLRYIAGFIPFALSKRYSKVTSPLGQKFHNVLLSWKIEEDDDSEADSFLAYTCVWLTIQNRGGLFRVSDRVFRFFKSLEIVVRKELQHSKIVRNSSSSTVKEILQNAIDKSPYVEKTWELLICGILSRGESNDLLATITNYFIKIRLNNFVKLYVNQRKREKERGVSKKGEKGLRKELTRKQLDSNT